MFSDPVLMGGVVAGLIMGSFGYVLFRFGWRPARKYGHLRKQIGAMVDPARQDALGPAERDRLRRLAVALHDLTTAGLPHWYQLALKRRNEKPEEAVRHLQRLANISDRAARRKRCQAVRQALGLDDGTRD